MRRRIMPIITLVAGNANPFCRTSEGDLSRVAGVVAMEVVEWVALSGKIDIKKAGQYSNATEARAESQRRSGRPSSAWAV